MVEDARQDRQDATGQPSTERVSVPQAADHLGTTVDAIRKRVQRGTIPHEKDAAGRVWILLDTGRPRQDTTGHRPAAREDLIDELRDRVRFLVGELERRGEEATRYQEIVARLSIANAQLSARLPELEAAPEASEEPPQSPESPTDEQQGRGPIPEGTSPEAASERPEERSWWRRLFGS
jgi:hypothetical protein